MVWTKEKKKKPTAAKVTVAEVENLKALATFVGGKQSYADPTFNP